MYDTYITDKFQTASYFYVIRNPAFQCVFTQLLYMHVHKS